MAVRNGRTVRDLRRGNRTAVLQRLYFDGPLSRFELGPATGLSSGSISNVVAELVADGLVEEAGSVDSDGGRPRTLLRVVPGSGHMIGVDVGETRVRVELFDLTLTELARTERALEQQGYAGDWASEGEGAAQVEGPSLGGGPSSKRREYDVDVIVGHIRDGVAEVLDEAGIAPERLLGVGIGVPGIVARTPEEGAVVHGQTIGWDAVPLESLLRSACQLPDTVPYFADNGARTLGQAEMWFGAGRGARNAVVVLFGSGVGACLVTEDVEHGRSVEWGHLTVRVRGRRCRCGALGCLEAYAGAEALLDRWREEGGRPPEGTDEETALTAMLTAAYPAEEGVEPDPVALAVLEETAEYLGAGLSDLINLFQPERILIGGWAGLQLGTRFLPAVRRYAASYALRYPAERVSIDLGRLGPDAVTVGAAILPLADFFARGGRRAEPVSEGPSPAWRTALEERAPH
ncbi:MULTISPECIES: ROK family transcriptional regulator [Streptomyces]|uniref:ROK family transcriptional regulator n=1 Tax=Streptomyces mirabilis TaxID=68239 RepID=A0ABU3UDV0_9ACTN|nr:MULTISPECIES: ROK family transcriptional regulator [Streptomyces]MCX4614224.1 ROK family transcriptional regulator [Streptomyces mirabilis]MCX5354351.1 ROK family transcriptional regulator [Streptomyces mirabilis]MDU8992069.1 ROK family transcriptional regulator [Streptomyces mirabilis]QDN92232.1 ROK family transcriptional regulator [Streptomyces sp. RLB3-6]QDO13057.1 ROK family transcriptional regulator [Streptomyces sp. S1D4-23]